MRDIEFAAWYRWYVRVYSLLSPLKDAAVSRNFTRNTTPAERTFDDRYDTPMGGGSFSCDLYVTASQARRVLDRFRSGVLFENEADLRRAIRFPLTVNIQDTLSIDEKARTITVRNVAEWITFQRANFKRART